MRILMCNTFYYLRGGSERCTFDLTALLEANGHEVIPFAMRHERNLPSPYADYFVSHVDFPTLLRESKGIGAKLQVAERTIYSREAKTKIAALIEATKPDIAHVHGIAHEISPSIFSALRAAKIPIVQTLHDYKVVCPNTNFVSQGAVCEACKGQRFYNVMRRRCKRDSLAASMLAGVEAYAHQIMGIYAKNIDAYIAPSRFLRDKVIEHGIRNEVVFLPNFLHVDTFAPCHEADSYFVYAGRLVDVKGVRTLLAAMRTVKGAKLYIAGTGELEEELRAMIAEQEITNVELLGHLGKEELTKLVRRASATIVPSEWYENCPMSVLESFACGTPVIGARIGGIPELVQDQHSGILFTAGNAAELAAAMQFAVDQPAAMVAMGQAARRQVERDHSPATHYAQTTALYASVLARR
ncbi:MAG TPA: glycosyltransferase family 4 protein [Caldilineaceae bacterium]|nr:glycosyltransferase family 4 protein [Caldilineaceae bacterium]